jgi:intracellular septation protein A
VNKSFIKFATDFGPLLAFFIIYYKNDKDLVSAIPALIIATLIAICVIYMLEKRIPILPLMGAVLVCLFGGLTIFFDNPIFIYLKPTIINLIFAFALFFGKVVLNKNFLKKLFESSIKLEEAGWDKLIIRWVGFFIFLAMLNEAVWRTQTEEFWINFKVWGILPITFVFTAFQLPLIQKYKKSEE